MCVAGVWQGPTSHSTARDPTTGGTQNRFAIASKCATAAASPYVRVAFKFGTTYTYTYTYEFEFKALGPAVSDGDMKVIRGDAIPIRALSPSGPCSSELHAG